MGLAHTALMPTRPTPRSAEFIPWINTLVALRLARCPIERATTRYVSLGTGSDANDGLTEATPWQTLARVQTYITGGGTDTCIKFRCGDEWFISVGINATTNNVTFSSYGTGAKPLFSNFPGNNSGPEFSVVGDNSYLVTASAVQWVRIKTNPLRFYTRATSQANCAATVGSWFHSGTSLWVRPFADEVATFQATPLFIEYVGATSADDAITLSGDFCRIHGLRADGWGMNLAAPGTQTMGFSTALSGTNEGVISDCEVYYASTHCLAQYTSGSGGIATFVNNKVGGTLYSAASGETIYNTFAQSGTSAETIFSGNETTYGTLPHNTWVSATKTKRGRSVYGHNGALAQHALAIVMNHTTKANTWGASDCVGIEGYQSAETNIANIKTFVIGEIFEENDRAGNGSFGVAGGLVRINCRYTFKPADAITAALCTYVGNYMRQWFLNCIIDIDLTNFVTDPFAIFNDDSSVATSSNVVFEHSQLNFRNSTKTVNTLTLDGWAANLGAGAVEYNIFVFNSIVTRQSGTASLMCSNGGNTNVLKNNALFGALVTGGAPGQRWDADAAEVNLGATWIPGTTPSASNGSTMIAAGGNLVERLQYDFAGKRRPLTNPTIGPLEPMINRHSSVPRVHSFDFGF